VRVLEVEPDLCTGCRLCELACSMRHFGEFASVLARIHVARDDRTGFALPVVCVGCTKRACTAVCPTRALRWWEGRLALSPSLCLGCRLCVMACPLGAMGFHPGAGIPLACDHCSGEPACVQACAFGALRYVDSASTGAERRSRTAARYRGTGGQDPAGGE
jgi:Fe-S-cluster-containing hydrogenase component 2